MSLFLSALIGDPISLVPMKKLVNKVRMLLGSSSDDNDDDDKEPEWKRRGDCCERMLMEVKTKKLWDGSTMEYGECRNCGTVKARL